MRAVSLSQPKVRAMFKVVAYLKEMKADKIQIGHIVGLPNEDEKDVGILVWYPQFSKQPIFTQYTDIHGVVYAGK